MDNMADGNRKHGETETSTKTEKFLSDLNKGFRKSKAQQILRLLKDQEELNHRFRECALVDDKGSQTGTDDDNWSLAGSDTSTHETEKKLSQRLELRKQRGGRSKTSMGFHTDMDHEEASENSDSEMSVYKDSQCASASRASQIASAISKRSVSFCGSQLDEPNFLEFEGVRSANSSRPKSTMSSLSTRNKRGHLLLDSSFGVPCSPRIRDDEINKQRMRITSVKQGDVLFRRTGVHAMDSGDFPECGRIESSRLSYALVSNHVDSTHHKRPNEAAVLDKSHNFNTEPWKAETGSKVSRTTSFTERGKFGTRNNKILQSPRSVLSVDNHPLHVQHDNHPLHVQHDTHPLHVQHDKQQLARVRPIPPGRSRKKKQLGELLRSPGQTTLNTITERTHPVAVMKLPPLETVKKTLPERDLICVGKEACV